VGRDAVHGNPLQPRQRAGARGLEVARIRIAAGLFLLCAAGVAAHDRITTKVTWDRDIAPLLEARCVRCHRDGGRGPMPLTTYDEARPWARAIKEEVLARRMPKWHAARGYGAFLNDPSLSPFEIALIVAWVDGGSPKGSGSAEPPEWAVASGFSRTSARELTVPCNNPPRIVGRLVAVQPHLADGDSIAIAVRSGREQQIVAWIRDFDPDFEEAYWLREPIALTRNSRLLAQASSPCTLTLWIDDDSSRRSPRARR
jgi:hypothetical protein